MATIISFSQFQSKYRFDCQLSKGSYGRVCRIQEIITKKYYAIKKVIIRKKQQLQDIQNEIKHLKKFQHPFIVQIKETYNIQIKNGFAKPIWEVGIIMQLAQCSLEQLIKSKKMIGSEQFILQQIAGLIRILFILQQQNIAHRDIKPANILVFQGTDNKIRWKLADFGLAVDLSQNNEEQNFAGSFQYASPKLKRKFKYPNLKIKTNSFKDDVYSLGVTLLQIITGLRIYNQISFQKLRSYCHNSQIINLIDIMLQDDQQKRPCFKQLMILIQKDYKNYLTNVQNFNFNNLQKINKILPLPLQYQYHDFTDKTIVKKHYKLIKKNIINVGQPIQCLTHIQDIIMCGCQNGSILFIKEGQIIYANTNHKSNISLFFQQQSNLIWQIGRDVTAKIWDKNKLYKALLTDVKQVKKANKKIFSKPQQTTYLQIDPSTNYYHQLKFPINNKSGVCSFFGQNQNKYVLGFYDGYVYIKWQQSQYSYKLFTKPVTAIKLSKNKQRFWLCSLDGQVKCIFIKQLSLINRFFYRENTQFIQLFLHQQGQQQFATLLTITGHQLYLNSSLQLIFDNQLTKNRIINVIKSDKNCYMLSDTGQIIDSNQQKIIQLCSNGWNCLFLKNQQQILAGSFTGMLAWISW